MQMLAGCCITGHVTNRRTLTQKVRKYGFNDATMSMAQQGIARQRHVLGIFLRLCTRRRLRIGQLLT
jgi:aminoglycoside/choline kinase family phosphotransferase